MKEVSYAPIIRDMTWSYSRIKSFNDCPYRWFLKYVWPKVLISDVFDGVKPQKVDVYLAYIRGDIDSTDLKVLSRYLRFEEFRMFFSDYGSFMHKLLEMYYTGQLDKDELAATYLRDFPTMVQGYAPNSKVFTSYFKSGLQYLREFEPFPYSTLAVEKRVKFDVDGIPFVGYIDYLGEDNGELVVVDHKSRTLKPRSTRGKHTKTDEELDHYLTQLYLYSVAVEKEYDRLPKRLCFNCFRTPVLIKEPFKAEAFAAAKAWLSDEVSRIGREKIFAPDPEFFKCKHLCEMQDCCQYYEP